MRRPGWCMFVGPMSDPVPLIIVTGFLGAGKTTMLNRVLGAPHGRRVGVIINELGRIDIDTRLIKSRSGDVMELVGGCVCHEVRVQSELWAAVAEVVKRSRARGDDPRDHRHRRAVVDPRRARRAAAPHGAGHRGRGRVRRRRRVGRQAARAPRRGARAGRGRRSDPAVEAGSRDARADRRDSPAARRSATPTPSAPVFPRAPRGRRRW